MQDDLNRHMEWSEIWHLSFNLEKSNSLHIGRSNFNNVTLPLLYKSLVRFHLEYGNVVWDHFYKEDMKKIERVQRRATKLIPEIHNRPYQEILRYVKLPSFAYRRKRGNMIYMYKIMSDNINIRKEDFFAATQYNTRGHSQKVFKPRAIKHSWVHTFSNRTIKDWNKLPCDIVEAKSVNSFKSKLDLLWINKAYNTLGESVYFLQAMPFLLAEIYFTLLYYTNYTEED